MTTRSGTPTDLIDTLLGFEPGSPLARLRARRPEATGHTQGSYDALFAPAASATTVTTTERFAAALRVARLHGDQRLGEHYAGQLLAADGAAKELVTAVEDVRPLRPATEPPAPEPLPGQGRLRAILAHADLLVLRPAAATPADLDALAKAGLGAAEIVTVSQLIAYVSFQVRLLAGLALIRGDERPAPSPVRGPLDAPQTGFTQEQLGWTPWLEPVAVEDVTDEQRAVLPGQRLQSPYFRLLALDPAVLGERTATDNGIFYTRGGLPRQERELAATVTSRVNGCVFCASVHSRFASQLSKRDGDVQRLLDEGVDTPLDDRWRAITDLAAALTTTPPTADQSHVAALRALDLDDLDILDAVQAAAFFAWANRLMLTLGDPESPAQH
ncbi:alkylhydroperoxidase domain protein [Streptomyces sp. NBS 14/10]|uniref:alkylhydroperoxidase domain protein n=1 Tax=Streptomyces sp. NBS 14/10 TaxID=1945643 RepID=UPI000B7F4020|nr:alkylhydroperoxidase domain protein [Streptomyces sp. NBS 14/10]KAK1177184.1 alkylhydroperoxidase domain protein [Streptomyces sp. NBS 14/10]